MAESLETDRLFQLDEVPQGQLLVCLRYWGTELLQAALGGQSVFLPKTLRAEQIQLFTTLKRRPSKQRKPYSRTVQDVVRGRQSMPKWLDLALLEAHRLLELNSGYSVPDGFWVVLGEQAWADLSYRHEVARHLETALNERTLFALQGKCTFPVFDLSPRTFWLLLSLSDPPARFGCLWHRQACRLVHKLQDLGQQLGLQSGWAGLWDQWVLLESVRSRAPVARAAAVRQALDELPLARLHQTERGSEPASHQKPAAQLAHPQWGAQMPVWFKDWWLASSAITSDRKE